MLTLMLSLTSAAMDFPASISRGWWSDSSRCCELAADHLRSWQAPSQAVLTCGQGTCAGTADGLAEASARRLQDELACRKPRLSACPSCQKTLLSWHFTTSQEMRFTSPAGSSGSRTSNIAPLKGGRTNSRLLVHALILVVVWHASVMT